MIGYHVLSIVCLNMLNMFRLRLCRWSMSHIPWPADLAYHRHMRPPDLSVTAEYVLRHEISATYLLRRSTVTRSLGHLIYPEFPDTTLLEYLRGSSVGADDSCDGKRVKHLHTPPLSTAAMSFFKLSLLLFSSISFHLGPCRTPSPDPEDKVMVKSTRERLWRHAAIPSDIFLKVSSFEITCD